MQRCGRFLRLVVLVAKRLAHGLRERGARMLRAGCLAGELGVAPVSHRRCVTWQIGERGPLAGVGALGCRRGGARLCGWLRRRPRVRGSHHHGLHHRRSGTGSGGAVEHAGIVEKPAANCREEHHDGAEQRDNYPVAPLSLGWLRLRLVVLLLGGERGPVVATRTGCPQPAAAAGTASALPAGPVAGKWPSAGRPRPHAPIGTASSQGRARRGWRSVEDSCQPCRFLN